METTGMEAGWLDAARPWCQEGWRLPITRRWEVNLERASGVPRSSCASERWIHIIWRVTGLGEGNQLGGEDQRQGVKE